MKRKNHFRIIKEALSQGKITGYYIRLGDERKGIVNFKIEYNKPIRLPVGNWSLTSEWYECSSRYFFSKLWKEF